MSPTALSFPARRSGRVTLLCLLAWVTPVASVIAQNPPPKAIPVEERTDPGPAPAPRPPRATAVPDTEPVPRTAPDPPANPRPAAGNTVPKTPEDDLFDYCELLFSKANYALALQQYQKYLDIHPNAKHREEVLFKMGECRYLTDKWAQALEYLNVYLRDYPGGANRIIALFHAGECHFKLAGASPPQAQAEHIAFAVNVFRETVQAAKTGQYVCYAAFRLGTFSYNAAARDPERYKESEKWFALSASQAPKTQPRIKVTSLFFLARSQRYLKKNKEATANFTEVTRIKEENTYFDQAWQELAQLDMEAGRTDEAMKKFERLSKESLDAETKASSLVNSGMIHAEAGRADEAIARFEEALKIPGDTARSARARARFGLVWSSYKALAHDKVIEAWRGLQGEDYGDMDEITRSRLWLIVGTSYAALDKHSPAAQTFKLLENLVNFPERQVREACQEGGYKRIVSLFKLNDPATVEAVDEYVRVWQDRTPEAVWIDKAWLVRGAWYFNRNVWDHAAKSYQKVRGPKLEAEKQVTWLYQRGCAEASSGDREAITTLTEFLTRAPGDERATMARLQRGLIRLKVEDLGNALTDFEEVAEKAAGTEAGETATYNAARVKGVKQDYPGMVAGFNKLLKDYPKTKAAAEANYWIGTGNYQQQKYKECLAPLRLSRSLDGRSYFQDASLMIIAALAAVQDVDGLIPEVDAYLKTGGDKKVSPDILRWLGMTLFRDRRDYAKAARYLGFIVTFSEPEKTAADIWAAHGECLLEIKDYEGCISAINNYLNSEQRPGKRARGFLLRGRAEYGLRKYPEADKSVGEGLDIERETLLAAQLHMLAGDIAVASNRLQEALSSYNNVRSTWEDPVLTPTAIWKMIALFTKSKDPKEQAEAESLKKELAQRFPKFHPPQP